MTSASESIAVVGAGAVGSYYGGLLARAGQRVTLIGREAHVRAIATQGLRLRRDGREESIAVPATTALDAVCEASLVLVAVKSADTVSLAPELARRLRPDALVLSLQNGVENTVVLAQALTQAIVPAVVYVAVSMPEPGLVLYAGGGELVIGARDAAAAADAAVQARLAGVVGLFGAAGVTVRLSTDVMAELWGKLLDRPVKSEKGGLHIPLDLGDIRFVEAKDGRGPGISALDVKVKDGAKVLAAAKARNRQLGPSQIQVVGCRINLL